MWSLKIDSFNRKMLPNKLAAAGQYLTDRFCLEPQIRKFFRIRCLGNAPRKKNDKKNVFHSVRPESINV